MECKQGQSSAKHQWEWMVVKVYPILITANCYKHFLLELCVRVCVEVRGQHLVSLLRHCPPYLWESPTSPKPVELQSLPYLYWDFKHTLPDLVVFPWALAAELGSSCLGIIHPGQVFGDRQKERYFVLPSTFPEKKIDILDKEVMGSL